MLKYVDCAIPCNNRSPKAVAMIWYLLTKAVLEVKKDTGDFEKNPSAYYNVEMDKKKDTIVSFIWLNWLILYISFLIFPIHLDLME
jgi:ribosomal protein S2